MSMNVKETIKFLHLIGRTTLVPVLLGHTGIGKTQVVEQLAKEQQKDLIIIHVAQLEPSDFIGLYQIIENRTQNCSPAWLPYKDVPEELKDKITLIPHGQGYKNPNGGIVFLDEFNRGHEDMRQAMYQFLNTKRIHTYSLPENYDIVAAANPPGLYETYEFDKALKNRCAWIKFLPGIKETLSYLTAAHGRNHVTAWISKDLGGSDKAVKSILDYGAEEYKIDDLVYTPRTCENHIKLWEQLHKEPKDFQIKALQTIMPELLVEQFITYSEDIQQVSWKDVILGENKTKMKKMLDDNRLDVLGFVTGDLADYFSKYEFGKTTVDEFPKKDEDAVLKRVTDFLYSAKGKELATTFIDALQGFSNLRSIEQQDYFKQKIKNDKLASAKTALKHDK
jgi:hypothetical protein